MTVKFTIISVTSFPETTTLKFLNIESVWRCHFGNCTFMISKHRTILEDIMSVRMIKNCKLFIKWAQVFMSCQWRKTLKNSEQGHSWDVKV